ncbi:LacI family DNA-binding transcriptional regulator [Erysipelatoclostridium ramosum]|nr:LacI family DNA-binding transcriptional regulator [Thomasclavelia ramosa]MCM1647155.1 LacI family DNA-binding transcriptional regulator [Thomasclavelia ramosa]
MMDNKITINEIAKLAGVSKTTISFYLNGKTQRISLKTQNRIATIIKQTNFQPNLAARCLNSKSSKLIGVLISDITNTFSNQIVKGIETIASKYNYQVIVGNSEYSYQREENYIEQMLSMGVAGFIVQPTAQFRKLSKKLLKLNKPLVFFDSKLYDLKSNWIKTNNYEATYETIVKCIIKGYESFYLITADPQLISTRLERVSGFIDALADYNFNYKTFILENDRVDFKMLHNFFESTLNVSKKSLVFVPNCWALPDIYLALKQYRNNMPQIGLIGFDNLEWVNFSSPSITTIIQPAFKEGEEAAKIVIDQIEGKNKLDNQKILNCYVNWNESTL